MFLHLHPHWRQSKNDHTLQEQESQHTRTLGSQPVHIVTLTYRHYLDLDQRIPSTMLDFAKTCK